MYLYIIRSGSTGSVDNSAYLSKILDLKKRYGISMRIYVILNDDDLNYIPAKVIAQRKFPCLLNIDEYIHGWDNIILYLQGICNNCQRSNILDVDSEEDMCFRMMDDKNHDDGSPEDATGGKSVLEEMEKFNQARKESGFRVASGNADDDIPPPTTPVHQPSAYPPATPVYQPTTSVHQPPATQHISRRQQRAPMVGNMASSNLSMGSYDPSIQSVYATKGEIDERFDPV